jgi:predicted transcriptional regulator
MSLNHYTFDTQDAIDYGVNEAILIQHFRYWIIYNKAESKNEHEGRTWTYSSQDGLANLFPFFSKQTIQRLLNSLVKNGVLIKGNYNPNPYDRTTWYAFKDEDKSLKTTIYRNRYMHESQSSHRPLEIESCHDSKSIHAKHDTTHDTTNKIDSSFHSESILSNFEIFWNAYPAGKRGSKKQAENLYQKIIASKKATHDDLMQGLENYKKQIAALQTEICYVKLCTTWLNPTNEHWKAEYQTQPINKKGIKNGRPEYAYERYSRENEPLRETSLEEVNAMFADD